MVNEKRAINTYNKIMYDLGYEYNTIGTISTENWNLRDMVAECDYTLSTFYESGHYNEELKYSDRKIWKNYTSRLSRFISNYRPYIENMKCCSGHCSQYDN